MKNVHSVYSAGIQTHDLHYMTLLTQPLDKGSRPVSVRVSTWFILLYFGATFAPFNLI